MISKKRNKIAPPRRIITRSERVLEQRDRSFTEGSHAVHLLFHLPNDSLNLFKDICSGNHIQPNLGEREGGSWGKRITCLPRSGSLPRVGGLHPKSIKNKLTHLSFLRLLLGTSTGTAVDFLAARCVYPKLGQRGGEWVKKVRSLGLPGSVVCSQEQILRDGRKMGKC